jgi:hypothetical protein
MMVCVGFFFGCFPTFLGFAVYPTIEGEMRMAIYTRLGAPVQVVEAELRRRWCILKPGRSEVYDARPTARQTKGAKQIDEFGIWWIKAKQVGPDGTGADNIGKFLSAPEDKTGRGFLDETFFGADGGIEEIHAECEMKRNDTVAAIFRCRT